jgi:hypothetical protein
MFSNCTWAGQQELLTSKKTGRNGHNCTFLFQENLMDTTDSPRGVWSDDYENSTTADSIPEHPNRNKSTC